MPILLNMQKKCRKVWQIYAKKMQKSLADCKKVCNFAAVFQNYVN